MANYCLVFMTIFGCREMEVGVVTCGGHFVMCFFIVLNVVLPLSVRTLRQWVDRWWDWLMLGGLRSQFTQDGEHKYCGARGRVNRERMQYSR